MKARNCNWCYLTVFLVVLTFVSASSQISPVKYDLYSLSQGNQLQVFNRKVTTFTEKDKKGIRFSRNVSDGFAWLTGVTFSNGIIELDMRGKDEFQRSFVGIAFHGVDNSTFDAIYFRPFNFQTNDPVRKIHAVQYVAEPEYPWQFLRDKFNGQCEKAVNPAPKGNEWFHVKIIVKYPVIMVFVNANPEACITVEKLNKRTSGKIGIWVGNNSDGDFANLQITSQD
jgi:hypothetical protein